jgi:hypothetical protein
VCRVGDAEAGDPARALRDEERCAAGSSRRHRRRRLGRDARRRGSLEFVDKRHFAGRAAPLLRLPEAGL